jgi:hypothetical protein
MVSHLFDEVCHCFWHQGPLNHLGGERQTTYIIAMLCQLLIFFHV